MAMFFRALPVIYLIFLSSEAYAVNCSVTTTPVVFGSYNVFSTAPLDATGTITLSCSNPAQNPIQVTAALSTGGSGSFNPRQMRNAAGTDRMNYYLFTDPQRMIIWGDGNGGTSTVTNTVTREPFLNLTIYGRAPARQDLRAGTYSDSLVVTVSW